MVPMWKKLLQIVEIRWRVGAIFWSDFVNPNRQPDRLVKAPTPFSNVGSPLWAIVGKDVECQWFVAVVFDMNLGAALS